MSLIPQFTNNDCYINSQSSHDSKIVWFIFHYLMNVWGICCLDWTGKELWFILEYDISILIVSYAKRQGGANVPMKMSSWEFHNSGIICFNGLPKQQIYHANFVCWHSIISLPVPLHNVFVQWFQSFFVYFQGLFVDFCTPLVYFFCCWQ